MVDVAMMRRLSGRLVGVALFCPSTFFVENPGFEETQNRVVDGCDGKVTTYGRYQIHTYYGTSLSLEREEYELYDILEYK